MVLLVMQPPVILKGFSFRKHYVFHRTALICLKECMIFFYLVRSLQATSLVDDDTFKEHNYPIRTSIFTPKNK